MIQILLVLLFGALAGVAGVSLITANLPVFHLPPFEATLSYMRFLFGAGTFLFVLLLFALAA